MTFPLAIDLPFLLNNPNKAYAIGVSISSTERKVNTSLNTTIVYINTSFLIPVANFTFAKDAVDAKKINFTNTSGYGVSYNWNFGDGSAVSTEKSPIHIYASAGTYTVTLTTAGVTGDAQKSLKTASVVVN
ncbi:MAG: PKD domain-containing protein [Flavobacterium sp.]|nr:PKD domain-containing protein [Pedobacter sp.]